jgi:hypothetical protein
MGISLVDESGAHAGCVRRGVVRFRRVARSAGTGGG